MNTAEPSNWPPIISFAHAPWLVRVRDVLMTFGAWALLLYLLRDPVKVFVDYILPPIFELSQHHPVHVMALWTHLQTFVYLSLAVMLWLGIWSIVHRHRLRLVARMTPPTPLALEKHAASFGLEEETIERWRKSKIAIVEFDATNRIARISPSPSTTHERTSPES